MLGSSPDKRTVTHLRNTLLTRCGYLLCGWLNSALEKGVGLPLGLPVCWDHGLLLLQDRLVFQR